MKFKYILDDTFAYIKLTRIKIYFTFNKYIVIMFNFMLKFMSVII